LPDPLDPLPLAELEPLDAVPDAVDPIVGPLEPLPFPDPPEPLPLAELEPLDPVPGAVDPVSDPL